ncbi:MAG: hypothetical protein K1Y36_10905 [Blastocatellia bacterium]|nr:hypothetical protein [Blastocatellia bacterium]
MKKALLLTVLLGIGLSFVTHGRNINRTTWFATGQSASRIVSAPNFNDAGFLSRPNDGLFFNHPGNVASDGTRLLLADKNNNRVLFWNSIPTGNTPPDLVLGQTDPTTNNPGTGLAEMNWPVGVAVGGGKVVVADSFNDRLLVWNSLPTRSGQPADYEIRTNLQWPWAVWTDGTKLIAASTGNGKVYLWNSFPTGDQSPPSLTLTGRNQSGQSMFGTPRTIGTDGKTYLVIGDHNSRVTADVGSFFWKSFPTQNDQPFDFSFHPPGVDQHQVMWGGVLTPEGKFVAQGGALYIWNSLPAENRNPDLIISGSKAGDGCGVTLAGSKVLISLANDNKIVGYSTAPASSSSRPDLVLGSPDLNTNTLDSKSIITNGVPSTDGTSLFVTSDFDRRLYVWRTIPGQNGQAPDFTTTLIEAPWDNALHNGKLAAVGRRVLMVWKRLPTDGTSLTPASVQLSAATELLGIALDGRYLYVSDRNNKVFVWNAADLETLLTNPALPPLLTLTTQQPARLASDGKYLVVVSQQLATVSLYKIESLSATATPVKVFSRQGAADFSLNLPQDALLADNQFFISDTVNSRVLAWQNVEQAISGNPPDAILGQTNAQSRQAGIGRNRLFWPGGLAYDGSRLWVGEYKFSSRMLAFRNRSVIGR